VPECGLQLFQLQGRGDAEHAPAAVEAAIGDKDVAVRIKSEEIARKILFRGTDPTMERVLLVNLEI
jgi:hypothetical protein